VRIDLLFSDVVLPNGMSGRALAELVRRRKPGLPVLFATGYTKDAILHQGRFDPDVRLLTKPYSLAALARNVREALDAGVVSAKAPAAAHAVPRRARILVVDDNADLALTLCAVLQEWGHSTHVARDGPSALAALATAAADIALLDIGLPLMDGYELARRIREDPRLERVRLVALTGFAPDSDPERSHGAGFHAFVQKPIDFERLELLLAEQLSSRDLH
jgi:CheY-like chemotaxis protein